MPAIFHQANTTPQQGLAFLLSRAGERCCRSAATNRSQGYLPPGYLTQDGPPEKTDFGRITLPGGHRVDFWGPFNEEARLIAREIAQVNNSIQGVKPKFGSATGLSLMQDYLRSKLGPVASAGASVLAGTNMAGKTPSEVVQSTLANPNPLSNPTSMVPAPFSLQTVGQAFDPAQGGQGGSLPTPGRLRCGPSLPDSAEAVKGLAQYGERCSLPAMGRWAGAVA